MANHKHSPLWLDIQKCKALTPIHRKAALNYINRIERYILAYIKDNAVSNKDYDVAIIQPGLLRVKQSNKTSVFFMEENTGFMLQTLFDWQYGYAIVDKTKLNSSNAYGFWYNIYLKLINMNEVKREAAKLVKLKSKG